MRQATLSVVMPVWNGEIFLAQTIESLLAQDYENIELIILDNISTDRTPEICKAYAQKDARVKYILDDSQKDFVPAEKKVSQFATGEFLMVASDDDWYAPQYVSTLMRLMMANPTVGIAYSGWGWIYPDGSKKQSGWKRFLRASNSEFYNFAYYLFFRTPIPLVFGIVRTELHRDALNYLYRPDHRGWNHDNLYMLRLLSIARVDSTTDILFYYRQRDRVALYKQRGTSYVLDGALARYLNSVRHQMSVTQALAKIIDASPFAPKEKHILKAYSLLVLLFYCTFVLSGIRSFVYKLLKRFLIATGAYRLIRKSQ
jgi:glycosyltransferase involved in cell wall biosynthesis